MKNNLNAIFIFIIALKVCAGVYLQTSEVSVLLGDSVVLPCNGSGWPVQQLSVQWEAMGKDVISLRRDVLNIGPGFEERVNFLSDPEQTQDFSLILSDVMLNDGEIYECLWDETKPICSVLLHVLTPESFPDYVEAFDGDDVTLECYGNIPKNKPWEDIYVQWNKDEREILRLSSGKTDIMIDYSIIALPPQHDVSRGNFSLTIRSVSVFDQGVYQCRYRSADYGTPISGFPDTNTLTVWAAFSEMDVTVSPNSSVSHWSSSVSAATTETTQTETASAFTHSSEPTHTHTDGAQTTTHTETGSTQMTTHAHTSNAQTTTDTQTRSTQMTTHTQTDNTESTTHTHTESEEETETFTTSTHNDGDSSTQPLDNKEFLEQLLDEEIPWIRIGIIAGVLLLTAAVLGLLLVFRRI